MSCNCNTANPTCEPCMICTPPGVTSLPDCNPVDPCEGKRINGACVDYAGIDFDCIGAYTGDDIFQVMFAILEYYIPLSSEECCGIEGGSVEYIPPTTTTSTTTTTTTTSTTTTTTTLAPFDCCITLGSRQNGPVLYNPLINTSTLVSIPGYSLGKCLTNTSTKIWSPSSSAGQLLEYNFIQTPFSATLSRTITYPSSYTFTSIFAFSNTLLYAIDTGSIPNKVVSINVTSTTAVITDLFYLSGSDLGVNLIHTNTGKLIVLTTPIIPSTNSKITQYSDITGTIEQVINVTGIVLTSLFECGGEMYGLGPLGLYFVDISSPYSIGLVNAPSSNFPTAVSTNSSCFNLDFDVSPPTTTTTTAAPLPVFGLEWVTTKNTGDVVGCEDAGWTISNNNKTITFNVADSTTSPCGGTCDIRQDGTATATITVGAVDTYMYVTISGMAETQDSGFDNCLFYLDNRLIVSGTSRDLNTNDCSTLPVVQTRHEIEPYFLAANTVHTFFITFTTSDSAWHKDVYYTTTLDFLNSPI